MTAKNVTFVSVAVQTLLIACVISGTYVGWVMGQVTVDEWTVDPDIVTALFVGWSVPFVPYMYALVGAIVGAVPSLVVGLGQIVRTARTVRSRDAARASTRKLERALAKRP